MASWHGKSIRSMHMTVISQSQHFWLHERILLCPKSCTKIFSNVCRGSSSNQAPMQYTEINRQLNVLDMSQAYVAMVRKFNMYTGSSLFC